jgi:2-keto-4-pentenoate hydratase/2-oxohepta-3-ene-1,7-dioic acid hydratase in catechol pathway
MSYSLRVLFLSSSIFVSGLQANTVTEVWAAGLTYQKHIDDSFEKVDHKKGPPIFLKSKRSLVLAENAVSVASPSEEEIYRDLERLEPGLKAKLESNFKEGFPLMLDYEAEIAFYFTQKVTKADLARSHLSHSVALAASNDLTLRSIQVLADGRSNKYDYWAVAKSFDSFLPYSRPRAVSQFPLDAWPYLELRTWVNGELRQNETTQDIVYSPRRILESLMAARNQNEIPAGTVLLTGTPTGTAFKLSRLKKLFSQFLFFARMTKLKIAANDAEKNPHYLRAGDKVLVEVKGVGHNLVVISP